MKIYVTHSTSFDFKKELYEPIRDSQMNSKYEIGFPHEKSDTQFNSKDYMKDCDLIIAEVSFPSTGQGIELGWANLYGKQIVCLFKTGSKPSGALKIISTNFIEYTSAKDMIQKLETYIESITK